MSGFCAGAYAKVWDIIPDNKSEKRCSIRLSISEKDQNDEWRQSFSGYVQVLGKDMADKAKQLEKGDTIRLKIVDVTNWYDKEKKATLVTYKCFNFMTKEEADEERAMKNVPRSTEPAKEEDVFVPLDSDEDLPF